MKCVFSSSQSEILRGTVLVPVVVELILIVLLLIFVLLIELYWYKQRAPVRKTINTQSSPVEQIPSEKVDQKIDGTDIENLYSNVHCTLLMFHQNTQR